MQTRPAAQRFKFMKTESRPMGPPGNVRAEKKPQPDMAERAGELTARLHQSKGLQALDIVKELFEIAKQYPLRSRERWKIGTEIFMAAINEPDVNMSGRIGKYVNALGYETERVMEKKPELPSYTATYYMRVPEERPAFRSMKPKLAKAPKAKEAEPKEKPPVAELEGPPKPEALAISKNLEPTAGVPAKAEEGKGAPSRAYHKPEVDLIPSPAKKAERYVSGLPRATSDAGKKSQDRISRQLLIDTAITLIVSDEMNNPPPAKPPILEEIAPKYQATIMIGNFCMSLPVTLYNPKMYVKYADAQKAISEPMRHDKGGNIGIPGAEGISGKYNADMIDRYVLIALLDNASAPMAERISVAYNMGRLRVVEAIPLLASILQNPSKHGASPELVRTARMALLEIGGSEAEQELKSDPNEYAMALCNRYMASPSKNLEPKLISFLEGGRPLEVGVSAAIALAMNERAEGVAFLAKVLSDPAISPYDRREIAIQLRSIAWRKNIEGMLISEAGGDAAARTAAAIALGGSISKNSVDALSRLFEDKDIEVRVEAADSLARMSVRTGRGKEDLLAAAAEEMLKKKARKGDMVAAAALAKEGMLAGGGVGALENALHSQSPRLRAQAAEGVAKSIFCGAVAPAKGVELLGELVRDPDQNVSVNAISLLKTVMGSGVGGPVLARRIREILEGA